MPDEENKPISEHSSLVQEATRIVLLSLQMLLLAHYEESDHLVTYQFSTEVDQDEYPFWLVVRGCHIEFEDDNGQLQLFMA